MGETADHSVMRRVNRSLVLEHIRRSGLISRAAIARGTSLARPTVSLIVDELIRDGTVREVGPGSSPAGGGRRPVLFEFNSRSEYIVGAQIGVEHTAVVVADSLCNELGRTVVDTPKTSAEQALGVVAQEIKALMRSVRAPKKRLKAVGVSVPGLIDVRTGSCVVAAHLEWRDVPVSEILKTHLRVPIFTVGTADAALALESFDGVAEGAKDAVLIHIGHDISASMLVNGRHVRGARGLAGVIGHCTVPGLTTRCACGKIGCLQTIADGMSITRAVEEELKKGRVSTLSKHVGKRKRLTAARVAEAAEAGDELAVDVMAAVGRALGLASSGVVNLLDLDVLVIAGSLAAAGESLLEPLRNAVVEHAVSPNAGHLRIASWMAGRDTVVGGAVLIAQRASETYDRVSSSAGPSHSVDQWTA